MGENVYFISDAHLGSGDDSRKREVELCRWLDQIKDDCCMLIMLGDIFDFWFSYRHLVPKGHVRLLGKMAELADRGVELHFFLGNHDMWMFDYLEKEIGAKMHSDPIEMPIGEKIFLIGHGDGLGHVDRKYDFLRFFFRSRFCQRLFALLPSAMTFPFARNWSDSNKMLHRKHNSKHYLGDDKEGIVMYCRQRLQKEHFDYCVFGHRHTPLKMNLTDDCVYLNTGDWLQNRNYAVYKPATDKLQLGDYASNW